MIFCGSVETTEECSNEMELVANCAHLKQEPPILFLISKVSAVVYDKIYLLPFQSGIISPFHIQKTVTCFFDPATCVFNIINRIYVRNTNLEWRMGA